MMKIFFDRERRAAVEVDENPHYRRMLCVAASGRVDIVKVTPTVFADRNYQPATDPRGASKFARTFAGSCLFKTVRAARVIKELAMEDLSGMSLQELVTEYNRITGKSLKKFESKAAGIKAITKASELKNVEADPAIAVAKAATDQMDKEREANGGELPSERAMRLASEATKETEVAKKATKTKAKAKAKPVKKAAIRKTGDAALDRAKRVAQMTKGSGGLIISYVKAGKLDDDAIVSKVLKEYPERKTTTSHVVWYRAMLRKAGLDV